MKIFVKILFLIIALTSEAKVEDHFKKIGNKEGFHQMRNIDFIYLINLDQRPEKYQFCLDQLLPYGIHPYRFSAVNGWELSFETINDVGVAYDVSWPFGKKWGTSYLPERNGEPSHEIVHVPGKVYFCHCMSRGAIGIVLSHLSVLQDAWDSGYETIWVMEDDIKLLRDPHILSDLIERLDARVGKEEWDILFTDQDTKNNSGQYVPCTGFAWRPNFYPSDPHRFAARWNIDSEFRHMGARFGAYSMIVRRSGMEKILNFFKEYQIFLPYDIELPLPPNIRLYAVIQDVVSTQPGSPSDNGGPFYKKQL